MKYTAVKIGAENHLIDIPESHQYCFHIVGMIAIGDRFILTHASLEEVVDIRPHLHQLSVRVPYFSVERIQYKETPQFSMNGNNWKEQVNGHPVCWLAWYDGRPNSPFFVTRDFFNGVNYKLNNKSIGVFDVTTKDVIFKATCGTDTAMQEISETL